MKKIFNVAGGAIILGVLDGIGSPFFSIDLTVGLITLLMSCAVYLGMIYLFMRSQGHGVREEVMKKKLWWGFREGQVGFYIFIGLVLLGIAISCFFLGGFHEQTVRNLQYLSLSWFAAYCVSFFVWHFNLYYDTYYFSESEARFYLGQLGISEEKVEELIAKLKEKGVLKK